jgi:hypothetical protein
MTTLYYTLNLVEISHFNEYCFHCVTSPRPHVEELLCSVEKMVAVVEKLLGNVMNGLANILNFMEEIKCHFAREAASQITADVDGMQLVGVGLATSTPPQGHWNVKMDNTQESNAVTDSHTSSATQSPSHTDGARGASFSNHVVVRDDDSSESAENKTTFNRVCQPHDTHAKRVHVQQSHDASPSISG